MSQSKFKVGSLLGSTALVALGVAFAGQATAGDHARVVKSSKDQVSLKLSGQFSREMSVHRRWFSNRVRHADSNYSSSRFRFHASGKINSDIKVNARNEIAFDDATECSEQHPALPTVAVAVTTCKPVRRKFSSPTTSSVVFGWVPVIRRRTVS